MSDESWNIGGLFVHDGELLHLYDAYAPVLPQLHVFGGMACHWHGGRFAENAIPRSLLPCILSLLEEYNGRGMGVRLVCSAPDAGDRLDDFMGNALVDMAATAGKNRPGLNGVIVSDDRLAVHIRRNWPELALISSMLRPTFERGPLEDSPAYYNGLAERYDSVVLIDDRGKDWDFLTQLHNPEKFEILANPTCRPACPRRAEHYALNIAVERFPNGDNWRELDSLLRWCEAYGPAEPLRLARADVARLQDMGFRHFKIAGRSVPWTRLHGFLAEYILPENLSENTYAFSHPSVLA